jgi:ferrous iron transport protein A
LSGDCDTRRADSSLAIIATRLQKGGVNLETLPLNALARVTLIDWDAIPETEAHRLRSLGLDEGAGVEALHRGILFWRDPIAVRVGRMTVALRRKVAMAVKCELLP